MHAITSDTLATRVQQLPSLPVVVCDIMSLIDAGDVDLGVLEKKVAQDQSLAARILRIANSPFYGFSGQIKTIKEAVVVLGLHPIRNLVVAAGIMKQFPAGSGRHLDSVAFWQHCIGTSVAARVLARHFGVDKELAFTAGLLHDIGKLAFDSHFPDDYARVLEYRAERDCHLATAEKAVLGMDHAEAGARLARHWKLPPPIGAVIEHHHRPEGAGGLPIVDLVHVADAVCRGLDIGNGEYDLVPQVHDEAAARLGVDWSGLKACLLEVEELNQQSNLFLAELTD